jgi:hypothetical protein
MVSKIRKQNKWALLDEGPEELDQKMFRDAAVVVGHFTNDGERETVDFHLSVVDCGQYDYI